MTDGKGEIVIFQENGFPKIDVRMEGETVWLTQKAMSELFGVGVAAVSKHLANIFAEGELLESATVSKMETVQDEGGRQVRRTAQFYNLDAIISVGYRVNSRRATRFRQWATSVLREYMVKGFAMDDERLKNGSGGCYWRELLDRIKDIRSSEKMLYRQVLDLYATSVDYDPGSDTTRRFFSLVQNKLHYAAHGHTAAEVVAARADAGSPFMGLTSFQGDAPTSRDILVAKNYLTADELKILNNLVSSYFDFAEVRAMRHIPTTMREYAEQLDRMAAMLGEDKVLQGAGTVSHAQAVEKAKAKYKKYRLREPSPVEREYLKQLRRVARQLEAAPREKA